MNKKKYAIISIAFVSLLIILVAGFTYAYLAAKREENITTGSGKLDVDYKIVQNITTGSLSPSNSKDDGLHGKVTAKLKTGSVPATFNIYVNTTKIATELKSTSLKWEVYGVSGGKTVYTNTGNFADVVIGTPMKIVDGYKLLAADTTFDVYIWLDGNLVTGSVVGKEIDAAISADALPITGEF